MTDSQYKSLGPSASKAGLHAALKRAGLPTESGFFAGLNDDLAGDPAYYSFIHCDGTGTKSLIAYLAYKETGDSSAYAGLAQDALVMNLDDIFCLGIPDSLLVANAIARNPQLVGDDAIGSIISGYKLLTERLRSLNIPITLGGGETADCPDIVRTLLVDAVITGRIGRKNVINTENIEAGDVIVGLSSTGKASYEDQPNSGIASNGITLARHALLSKHYTKKYPEVVDPNLKQSITYRGPFRLDSSPKDLGMSIADALLSPTRSYAPILTKVYSELPGQIHAVIHNTGGGLTKVLRFGTPAKSFKKNSLFDTPALFKLIQEHGNVSWKEMYQVFNMGHRMELYLPESFANTVIDISSEFGIEAKIIGEVESRNSSALKNQVQIESPHGVFKYELSDES